MLTAMDSDADTPVLQGTTIVDATPVPTNDWEDEAPVANGADAEDAPVSTSDCEEETPVLKGTMTVDEAPVPTID